GDLEEVDAQYRSVLTSGRIRGIISLIPDEWLTGEEQRQIYSQFLESRIAASHIFVKEAQYARKSLI
ncbi:MAG: aminotransferase class I and II, partial [Chitinophaga rupis]